MTAFTGEGIEIWLYILDCSKNTQKIIIVELFDEKIIWVMMKTKLGHEQEKAIMSMGIQYVKVYKYAGSTSIKAARVVLAVEHSIKKPAGSAYGDHWETNSKQIRQIFLVWMGKKGDQAPVTCHKPETS